MTHHTLFILLMLLSASAWGETKAIRVQALGELLRQPEFSVPASVEPLNAPSLAAEISGRIESIPVHVGDRVRAGDLLAGLDCRIHRSRLQAHKAQLKRINAQRKLARTQLQRARALNEKQTISDELVDQRNTELLGAQAEFEHQQEQIRQAEIDVERCEITAPFDAIVTQRLGQVGGLATPGTPLLDIVQLDNPEVSAEVSNAEAATLEQAKSLTFEYDGTDYALRLQHLLPVVDERTRTREARLLFTAAAAPVGAAGRLMWQGVADELPAEYLVRRNGRLGVFIAERDTARFYPLPGAREGQPVRLDIPGDRLLVTEGRQRLQDGDVIDILRQDRLGHPFAALPDHDHHCQNNDDPG